LAEERIRLARQRDRDRIVVRKADRRIAATFECADDLTAA
jgi:hypothetical protein